VALRHPRPRGHQLQLRGSRPLYILAQPETPEDSDNALVSAAGAEATLQDRTEFERRFGLALPLTEGYTSSEEDINIGGFPGMPEGALGRPFLGQDVIVADAVTGEECPRAVFGPGRELLNGTEAIGEIVRRDSLGSFEGYYANDEANAARTRNGWFWSGDLAYRDDDGVFYFAGRGIDWIRVDSENFAAAPIDRILTRHPDAVSAVAYAVPDPLTGGRVMAVLELRHGTSFDPEAFSTFLDAQGDLGTKWAPHFLRIVDEIPVTGNGKVDRKPLQAQRWRVADPVWWRPGRALDYRLLTDDDIERFEQQFEDNGRSTLLR
jgi:fatty-acyl-CoA synthase